MAQQFFAEGFLQQLPTPSVTPVPPSPTLVGIRTIFPHIDAESEVQLNDRTRIDASKTFHLPVTTAPTYIAIKPGEDETKINIYNANAKLRFLDWEFLEWKQDVDSTNNKIDFNEGGSDLVATLDSGTYTRDELALEIKTQLDLAGALTYTVSFDELDKLTIAATGVFSLVPDGANRFNLSNVISYFDTAPLEGLATYTSSIVDKLSRKVSIYAGENRYNVQTITCVANTSHALNNKYFFLYSAGNEDQYYFWFNSSGTGTDPNILDYTGVEVSINNNDTNAQVATALQLEIDAVVGLTASVNSNIVTVTNDDVGWCTPASDGAIVTGLTYSIVTEGQFQSTDFIFVSNYKEQGDYLFSTDADLMQFEPDIRKWVADGRNTFLNVHRQAQKHIIEWLDRAGYVNTNNKKYTKFDLLDKSEVKEWARFTALRMIFEGIKNSQDEVFLSKRQTYEDKESNARNRAILRIDKTGNDTLTDENINHSVSLGRQ